MNAMFGDFEPQLPPLPWGPGGQPSQNPMMQQQVQQQVAALRNQMQQREQMRYGMPGQQDPQVGAMMQELESRLGGGPQWRDTTGLGGRMSRLPMPQEQQAPQGPQQDPGLLMQALQLAARNNSFPDTVPEMLSGQGSAMRDMDGGDGRTAAQHGWPGATQGRQVLDRNSQIPLSEEPWFDAYVAAGQGGADLPTISGGGATESPDMLARRAAHREARIKNERAGLLPMEERRAMVRSNAIAKSADRHARMGIPDREPQLDLLNRLQGMEGGNDPTSRAGFAGNAMVMGQGGALGAMKGRFDAALQEGQNAIESAKTKGAAILAALAGGMVPPQQVPQMIEEYKNITGGQDPSMAAAPQGPSRERPGGPMQNAGQDAGLQALWASKPDGWSGEMFIRKARESGYSPNDAIMFMESIGRDNPRAGVVGGMMSRFPNAVGWGATAGSMGLAPPPSILTQMLEDLGLTGNPPPAKLPARFANQLPQ